MLAQILMRFTENSLVYTIYFREGNFLAVVMLKDLIAMSEEDFIIVFSEDAHTIISDFDKSKALVTVIAKVRIFSED